MMSKTAKGAAFAHTLYGKRADHADLYVMVAAYTQDQNLALDFCGVLEEWGIEHELCLYGDSPFRPVREYQGKTPSELVLIQDKIAAEKVDAVFEDIVRALKVNSQELEEQWRVNICTTSRNFYKDFRSRLGKETLLDKIRQHTLISSEN